MRRYIISILTIAAMVGCNKENDNNIANQNGVVNFSSKGIAVTRTTEMVQDGETIDVWEMDDRVGITTDGFSSDYANAQYKATASQSVNTPFEVVDASEAIYYPVEESGDVVFYAYYPYTSKYEDGIVTASIADQLDDIGSVDFMTAAVEGQYKDSGNDKVAFSFDHKLSKLIFNVTINSELKGFTDLTVTAKDIANSAKYNLYGEQVDGSLSDNKDVELTTTLASDKRSALVTAILHPNSITDNGVVFEFKFDNDVYSIYYSEPLVANTIRKNGVIIGRNFIEFTEGSTFAWDEDTLADTLEKEVWDGETVATSFNGVVYDPELCKSYEITNGEELAYVAELVNSDDYLTGITFTMKNNIDLGDHEWVSLGADNYGEYKMFDGIFDGGGYVVKRLKLDKTDSQDNWGIGLFRYLNKNGVIKNLNVEGNIKAGANCGGIVGQNNGGTIDNCSFSGSVTGDNYGDGYVGGIVGSNESGVVKNCYNMGTIKGVCVDGTSNIGGVVGQCRGFNYEDGSYTGVILSCYNLGDVESTSDHAGGIVGQICEGGVVESCFNSGTVKCRLDAGGIVGLISDSSVESTYNTGTVSVSDDGGSAGGIVGRMWNISYGQSYCGYSYNYGIIKGLNNIAGVVGVQGSGADITIENCCALAQAGNGYTTVDSDGAVADCVVVNRASDSNDLINVGWMPYADMRGGVLDSYLTNGDWQKDILPSVNSGYPILKDIEYKK